MPKYGITETNIEVERLLDKTQNPRHRYLLMAFARHRYLEIAGRYSELLGPDMTVEQSRVPLQHHRAAVVQARRA